MVAAAPSATPRGGARPLFFCQSLTSYIENYIERVIYETLPLINSIIYYYLLDVPSVGPRRVFETSISIGRRNTP